MPNIERRRNVIFATLHVPKDVRGAIGRAKLIKTTKTTDKRLGQERANLIVAEWKAMIRAVRAGRGPAQVDDFAVEALGWREALKTTVEPHEREALAIAITDKAEALEATKGYTQAKTFADIAMGVQTPLEPLVEPWVATIADLAPKTKALYIPTVKKMAAKFKTLEAVDRKAVKAWILELGETVSGATIQRTMGACQNFWEYLQARDMVSPEFTPWRGNKIKVKSKPYVPFKPAEVVTLWNMAKAAKKHSLSDLIKLGAYSGARIGELCNLKVGDIKDGYFQITDSKTTAGVREVPIHSSIKGLIERLKEESKDGYLIPSSAENKQEDRSAPHSKVFGRLKDKLGYTGDRTRSFHSIRKTMVTQLEGAGVPEGVTADIVGHEKDTITYGLYSGGNPMEVKQAAIEKLRYPF